MSKPNKAVIKEHNYSCSVFEKCENCFYKQGMQPGQVHVLLLMAGLAKESRYSARGIKDREVHSSTKSKES